MTRRAKPASCHVRCPSPYRRTHVMPPMLYVGQGFSPAVAAALKGCPTYSAVVGVFAWPRVPCKRRIRHPDRRAVELPHVPAHWCPTHACRLPCTHVRSMLACVRTAAVFGIEAVAVNVEVDVSFGLPMFTMVGLPDASVRESRDRVRAAIRNCGFEFPSERVTVNLAPADVRKAGAAFDLPIAVGVLAAAGIVECRSVEDVVLLGELSLDGAIQGARGVLPIAVAARAQGATTLLLPAPNAAEAAVVAGLRIWPVTSLTEAVRVLNDPTTADRLPRATARAAPPSRAARPGRGTRPGSRPQGARDCCGGTAPPAAGGPSGRRQDHARPACARNPAGADVRRGARIQRHSLGGRHAALGRRPARRTTVPRTTSHHLRRGAGGRRNHSAAGRDQPRASTASCFSTRCRSSTAACSKCSASRSNSGR